MFSGIECDFHKEMISKIVSSELLIASVDENEEKVEEASVGYTNTNILLHAKLP